MENLSRAPPDQKCKSTLTTAGGGRSVDVPVRLHTVFDEEVQVLLPTFVRIRRNIASLSILRFPWNMAECVPNGGGSTALRCGPLDLIARYTAPFKYWYDSPTFISPTRGKTPDEISGKSVSRHIQENVTD